MSKTVTCKFCGYDNLGWAQSKRTGRWYLADRQRVSGDYEEVVPQHPHDWLSCLEKRKSREIVVREIMECGPEDSGDEEYVYATKKLGFHPKWPEDALDEVRERHVCVECCPVCSENESMSNGERHTLRHERIVLQSGRGSREECRVWSGP